MCALHRMESGRAAGWMQALWCDLRPARGDMGCCGPACNQERRVGESLAGSRNAARPAPAGLHRSSRGRRRRQGAANLPFRDAPGGKWKVDRAWRGQSSSRADAGTTTGRLAAILTANPPITQEARTTWKVRHTSVPQGRNRASECRLDVRRRPAARPRPATGRHAAKRYPARQCRYRDMMSTIDDTHQFCGRGTQLPK
jgi:hypothetical protein